MTNELAVVVPATITKDALSPDDVLAQVQTIQQVMSIAMRDNEHYGVIPGTQKPTLLKPGAEKLCLTFRLDPEYTEQEQFFDDGHYYVKSTCTLFHIPTQLRIASGVGSCTTRESKYAYRNAQRVCPDCGKPFLLKSKQKPEWFCWNNPSKDKHGCGAKFPEDDARIVNQEQGKVPNLDLADSYNTVLKMASKRALVAAVLNGTAASDIFTQDLEDRGKTAQDSGGAAPAPNVEGAADEQAGKPSASPPVSDWVDDAADSYGEGELIDAAEAVRQEMGVGSQITALSGVRLVAEGSDPHRRIIERLDKAQAVPEDDAPPATEPLPPIDDLVRQMEVAITAGVNGPNGKKITRNSIAKALLFETTHNGGVVPSGSDDLAAWPEDSLRTVAKELNLEALV